MCYNEHTERSLALHPLLLVRGIHLLVEHGAGSFPEVVALVPVLPLPRPHTISQRLALGLQHPRADLTFSNDGFTTYSGAADRRNHP